ncbi:MAG: hypothetical protein KGS61_05450 [Verrucomicrobia bacterium]|nr:hypothetical protein [Verrucomicrobiota bacterium]
MCPRNQRPYASGLEKSLHPPATAGLRLGILVLLAGSVVGFSEVRVVVEHHEPAEVSADFTFKTTARPSAGDASAKADFTIVEGRPGAARGDHLDKLHDGRLPDDEDDPVENFFFADGTDGGRLLVDLGKAMAVKAVNTYSWHPSTRAPQVYSLYASAGQGDRFDAQPSRPIDPVACGWTLIAQVDTRPKSGEVGGQYGASVSDTQGSLGTYRYLLFDIRRTETTDPFGNTFYSEIDVIDRDAPPAAEPPLMPEGRMVIQAESGRYQITLDTVQTPDLREWAERELAPVLAEWYPRIVDLLPGMGYEAPRRLTVTFSDTMRGVAATSGTHIRCAAAWFRQNLKGEAKGAVVHEMVHVVQQYGRARRTNPNARRSPGWLVEGIADYIRWFKYEPQSHGADVTPRNLARARYDGNYRISANFLNWVSEKHDPFIVGQINAALRDGQYDDGLWQRYTGKTVEVLGEEWKADLAAKLAAPTR